MLGLQRWPHCVNLSWGDLMELCDLEDGLVLEELDGTCAKAGVGLEYNSLVSAEASHFLPNTLLMPHRLFLRRR